MRCGEAPYPRCVGARPQTSDAKAAWGEMLAMLTPDAIAATTRAPPLRATIHRHVAATFRFVDGLDAFGAWAMRNRSRIQLSATLLMLATRDIGLTPAEFVRAAASFGLAGRGTSLAFLARAQAAGYVVIVDRHRGRHIEPQRPMVNAMRRWLRICYGALAIGFPDVAPTVSVGSDSARLQALGQYCLLLMARVAQAPKWPSTPVRQFYERDLGMRFLYCLIEQQPREQPELIASAALSRRQVAARLKVSRIHLNRLIEDSVDAGVLLMPTPDTIVFPAATSRSVEANFAGGFQLMRAMSRILELGPRIDQGQLARIDRIDARR